VQDVPYIGGGVFDQFASGPDLDSYRKYQKKWIYLYFETYK